jgi:hypothetical protein
MTFRFPVESVRLRVVARRSCSWPRCASACCGFFLCCLLIQKKWVWGGCLTPPALRSEKTHVYWSARRVTGCSSNQPLVASDRSTVIKSWCPPLYQGGPVAGHSRLYSNCSGAASEYSFRRSFAIYQFALPESDWDRFGFDLVVLS